MAMDRHPLNRPLTLLVLGLRVLTFATTLSQTLISSVCQQTCGDIGIPFPFEITPGCGLPDFTLNCTSRSILSLTINSRELQVLEISAGALIVQAPGLKANACSDDAVGLLSIANSVPYALSGGNRFYVKGCNASGSFTIESDNQVSCQTSCHGNQSSYSFCEPSGCCTVKIPSGCRNISLQMQGSSPDGEDKCAFASVVYPPSYNVSHLQQPVWEGDPIQLLWAITEGNCAIATSQLGYVCSSNATCVDVEDVPGYICECNRHGYAGDGYIKGSGCLDINECAELMGNRCAPDADCLNTLGSYACHCLEGFNGDGYSDGSGCTAKQSRFSQTILLGCLAAVALLISLGSAIFWRLRIRHFECK